VLLIVMHSIVFVRQEFGRAAVDGSDPGGRRRC
jgi:hypothetical protein